MPDNNIVNSNFYKIAVVDGSDNVVGITAAPANVKITGSSSAGQTLTADGSGGLAWAAAAGGAVTGEYRVFCSNPGSSWLPAGSGPYNVSAYPQLGTLFANTTNAAGTAVNYVAGGGGTTALGFGGGRYVRIGGANPTTTGTPTQFSTDGGATWTAGGNLPVLPSGSWASNITWNGTVFLVVAYISGVGIGATSTNGVTWTQRNLPTPTGSGYYGCGSLGSILAAVQYSATSGGARAAFSSDNGATWSSVILPFNNVDFIAGGDGKFVVATYGSNTGATSSDNGSTWTTYNIPGGGANWDCAIWTGTYWLMGHNGPGPGPVMSFNGINWFNVTNPGGTNVPSARLFWTGKYVIHPDTVNTRVLIYTDPRGTINQIGGMGGSWWAATDSSNPNRFLRDLGTQSQPVTITTATTFTAGSVPATLATGSLGTWWIKS